MCIGAFVDSVMFGRHQLVLGSLSMSFPSCRIVSKVYEWNQEAAALHCTSKAMAHDGCFVLCVASGSWVVSFRKRSFSTFGELCSLRGLQGVCERPCVSGGRRMVWIMFVFSSGMYELLSYKTSRLSSLLSAGLD